jgi:predicted lipid-binding transport protein (Tim44 family)
MSDEVFEFGERTIMQMRNQQFTPDEEFGTVVLRPAKPAAAPATIEAPADAAPAPASASASDDVPAPEAADPIVRLEQKLDTALQMILSLQHRIDSLDATLARLLMR